MNNVAGPRVNSDAAQILASSPKDVLESTVFSCCRKAASDSSSLMKDGREFNARAAATGNARCPGVCRRVAGTISVDVAADRRQLEELRPNCSLLREAGRGLHVPSIPTTAIHRMCRKTFETACISIVIL